MNILSRSAGLLPADGLAALLKSDSHHEPGGVPEMLIQATVAAAVQGSNASPRQRAMILARRILIDLATRPPRKPSDTMIVLLRQCLQPKRGSHD